MILEPDAQQRSEALFERLTQWVTAAQSKSHLKEMLFILERDFSELFQITGNDFLTVWMRRSQTKQVRLKTRKALFSFLK